MTKEARNANSEGIVTLKRTVIRHSDFGFISARPFPNPRYSPPPPRSFVIRAFGF